MRTIEGKTFAWISKYSSIGPNELNTADGDTLVGGLAYSSKDMTDSGWIKVGEASVTVKLLGMNGIVSGQVKALRSMQKDIAARAEAESTRIEGEIQTLLAITYEPEV